MKAKTCTGGTVALHFRSNGKSVNIITIITAAFSLALFLTPCDCPMAASCCGGKAGGGPRVGAFSGNVMLSREFLGDPHDDTLAYFVNITGYYGNSWAPDGHTGDPLGTGGKWPLTYALELYREQTIETQELLKRDLREQYVDFGYIPLWRYNTLTAFGRYRLSPDLRATIQTVYGGEPGKPGTNANGSLGIGEVSLTWMPVNASNFWLKAGNILDGGTYSSLFDQNPLENFLFTGAVGSLHVDFGEAIQSVFSLSIGGAFQNVTYLRDPTFDFNSYPGYIHSSRQRTYAYAKSNILIDKKIGLKALAGVQFVPEDSSQDVLQNYYRYQSSLGSMGGLELTYFGDHLSHTFVFSAASGDAPLGFGSPDYVLKALRSAPIEPDKSPAGQYVFTKDGSMCLNAIEWSALESGNFHLSAGVWFTQRIPAKQTMTMTNPTPDSLRALLPAAALRDSVVTLTPQNFSAIKVSIFPTYQIGFSPLFIGLRYDNITYLTPNAHTNIIEPDRDQTLRPVLYPGIDGSIYGPAKWDREAVNANIFSPTLRLDFKEIGGITCAYAIGLYDKPVDRQGSIAKVHANITIGADLSIVIKKGGWVMP